MTDQVILQPQAKRSIQQQARWLAEQSKSPAIALRWLRSTRTKIDTLKAIPLRCPIDPDSGAYGEAVEHAMNGEEVIIAKAEQPVVRLVPIRADESPRVGGQWKGRVRISEDFDTLPDGMSAAFGIDPA